MNVEKELERRDHNYKCVKENNIIKKSIYHK